MRIIKEGKDKNKLPVFTCIRCGCEFECSKDEYYTDTNFTLCSYPPQYHAVASCPNCHKICTTCVEAPVSEVTLNDDCLTKKDSFGESIIYTGSEMPKVTLTNHETESSINKTESSYT